VNWNGKVLSSYFDSASTWSDTALQEARAQLNPVGPAALGGDRRFNRIDADFDNQTLV